MIVVTINLFLNTSFSQDRQNKLLQIIVQDTGIGISGEKQQYICEKFVTFNSILQCKGLGLGLIFVRQLIHEMHGEIELSSEKTKTTTVECRVSVKLPTINN